MKNKQLFNIVKNEGKYLGILFIIFIAVFKLIFFNENILVIIRTIFALFYLIILPGYFIMLYWSDKLDFKERIVIGIAAGSFVVASVSYHLGVLGMNLKYQLIPIPLIVMIGAYIVCAKLKNIDQKKE